MFRSLIENTAATRRQVHEVATHLARQRQRLTRFTAELAGRVDRLEQRQDTWAAALTAVLEELDERGVLTRERFLERLRAVQAAEGGRADARVLVDAVDAADAPGTEVGHRAPRLGRVKPVVRRSRRR